MKVLLFNRDVNPTNSSRIICRWIFFARSLGRKERYQFLWPLVLAAAYKVGKATWASMYMLLVLTNSNFAVSLAALICPWLIAYLCQIVAVDLEWSAQITDSDTYTQTDLENPLRHKSQLHKSPIHWTTAQCRCCRTGLESLVRIRNHY